MVDTKYNSIIMEEVISDEESKSLQVPFHNDDDDHENNVDDHRPTRTTMNRTKTTYLVVGILVMVCLVTPIVWLGYTRNSSSTSTTQPAMSTITAGIAPVTVALMGKKKSTKDDDGVRKCTFDECKATTCDVTVAPYKCLLFNGGPHGGCSSIPWSMPDTCTDQCDTTSCASVRIPKDEKNCKNIQCSKDVCNDERVCPDNVRYQCIVGSANFGCSADKYLWAYKTSGATCSKCCDTTTC